MYALNILIVIAERGMAGMDRCRSIGYSSMIPNTAGKHLIESAQKIYPIKTNKLVIMPGYESIKADVVAKLESHLPEIRERFGIDTLGLFGSVSRGEDTPESDVDVLYLFRDGRGGMFDLVGLHDYLAALFNREVDLISFRFISPIIEKNVCKDAVVIKEASA